MNDAMRRELAASILSVADIHAGHIQEAMRDLAPHHPFSEQFIIHLNRDQLASFEFFVHRFIKLQDLMGAKLFELMVELAQAYPKGPGILDMLDALEKVHLIDSTETWRSLREIRNHLTHEYPDQPELTAKYLNDAFSKAPALLKILSNMKTFIQRLSS